MGPSVEHDFAHPFTTLESSWDFAQASCGAKPHEKAPVKCYSSSSGDSNVKSCFLPVWAALSATNLEDARGSTCHEVVVPKLTKKRRPYDMYRKR